MKLLKRSFALWHGWVSMKKDQVVLFRRRSLLRKGFKGLVLHMAVTKEMDKMAVWKHNRRKAKLYLRKVSTYVSTFECKHACTYVHVYIQCGSEDLYKYTCNSVYGLPACVHKAHAYV